MVDSEDRVFVQDGEGHRGVEKLTWLSAMIGFGPALAMFSWPDTSIR
ncbi:MAG: hypothetical protein R3D62_16950 [Xanthobacteraceae bacterium]